MGKGRQKPPNGAETGAAKVTRYMTIRELGFDQDDLREPTETLSKLTSAIGQLQRAVPRNTAVGKEVHLTLLDVSEGLCGASVLLEELERRLRLQEPPDRDIKAVGNLD